MVPLKGRLSFKQYMPAQPTKWEIKMYALAEAGTGYISFCKIYSGGTDGTAYGLVHRVVKLCLGGAGVLGL